MNEIKVKGDTEFAQFARQLQNDWRVKKGFQIGGYKNNKGEFIELGNYIEEKSAFKNGSNFLTPSILEVVNNSLRNKEHGAKIEKTRLFTNLLSSQPLAFNLFAELAVDNKLATRFFNDLFPDRVSEVTGIIFEHSDGRGDCNYTGDYSAFDVFVEYTNNGKNGFIGIEVKYSESLTEETKEKANETFLRHQKEYTRLTNSRIFKQNSVELLKEIPLSQIWRDHLLSIAHLKDYDEGFFVFLFPKENSQCQNGVDSYKKYLVSKKEEQSGFYPRYLDDLIRTLRTLHNTEWTRELEERYLGTN